MKISKAIEILEYIIHHIELVDSPDEHDAVSLGIEALKRLCFIRERCFPFTSPRLPGETPDER